MYMHKVRASVHLTYTGWAYLKNNNHPANIHPEQEDVPFLARKAHINK